MAETAWESVMLMTRGKYQKKHWVEIIKGEKPQSDKTGNEIFAEICAKAMNRGEMK